MNIITAVKKFGESMKVSTLDGAIKVMREKKNIYSEAKTKASLLHAEFEEAEAVVMQLMEECGKTKYIVEGLGITSVREDTKVKWADVDSELFLSELYKRDRGAYYGLVSVNYQSLNSWYNAERGEEAKVDYPGMPEEPIRRKVLRFTTKGK